MKALLVENVGGVQKTFVFILDIRELTAIQAKVFAGLSGARKYHPINRNFGSPKMLTNAPRLALLLFFSTVLLENCATQPCLAHGAAPKKLEENIQIAAPPDKVWNIIKDFAGISSWDPKIKKSEAKTDEDGNKQRIMTLDTGGQVTDALTDYEADKMTYSYRRVDEDVKALPSSFYSATITVSLGKGGGSDVSWIGRYYRGDTSNEPPPELTDEAAAKALGDLFQAGLKNLKTLAEKK